jgi:Soluble lytic murein transglycosylase and related regulatory proteins (some contain LysM/invasin domains)
MVGIRSRTSEYASALQQSTGIGTMMAPNIDDEDGPSLQTGIGQIADVAANLSAGKSPGSLADSVVSSLGRSAVATGVQMAGALTGSKGLYGFGSFLGSPAVGAVIGVGNAVNETAAVVSIAEQLGLEVSTLDALGQFAGSLSGGYLGGSLAQSITSQFSSNTIGLAAQAAIDQGVVDALEAGFTGYGFAPDEEGVPTGYGFKGPTGEFSYGTFKDAAKGFGYSLGFTKGTQLDPIAAVIDAFNSKEAVTKGVQVDVQAAKEAEIGLDAFGGSGADFGGYGGPGDPGDAAGLGGEDVATGGKITKKAEGGRLPGDMRPRVSAPPVAIGQPESPEGLSTDNVADDVPMKGEDGGFVINAPAVAFAGHGDVVKMIASAIQDMRQRGKKITLNGRPADDKAVNLLVSRGEIYIPPAIAKEIGYDRLNKINNRGKKQVAKLQEREKQEQPQQAAEGGYIRFVQGGEVPMPRRNPVFKDMIDNIVENLKQASDDHLYGGPRPIPRPESVAPSKPSEEKEGFIDKTTAPSVQSEVPLPKERPVGEGFIPARRESVPSEMGEAPTLPDDEIGRVIREAAEEVGVPLSVMTKIAYRESGFRPSVKNKKGSATGLYQFISDTWLGQMKQYGSDIGVDTSGMSSEEILELRKNPEINARIGARFIRDNSRGLKKVLGRDPTDTEIYTAHFLGQSGARSFLTELAKNPSKRAEDHFPASFVESNPELLADKNLGEVYLGLQNKMYER